MWDIEKQARELFDHKSNLYLTLNETRAQSHRECEIALEEIRHAFNYTTANDGDEMIRNYLEKRRKFWNSVSELLIKMKY